MKGKKGGKEALNRIMCSGRNVVDALLARIQDFWDSLFENKSGTIMHGKLIRINLGSWPII